MGWNQGYAIFEATVIGAYDLGKLDRDLLAVLMEPYRGTDIDSAGSRGLCTKDGKDLEQVVIEAWGLSMPDEPMDADGEEALEEYDERVWRLFYQVTEHFGWV